MLCLGETPVAAQPDFPNDWMVKLLRSRKPVPPASPPAFGPWILRHFALGEATAEMSFPRLEKVCSNAGSALCGAVFAEPGVLASPGTPGPELLSEADLVAKRTGDGFKACLEDRQHTVLTWPWDHLATRVAWEASRTGDASEEAVGRRLGDIGAAYATVHREQLAAVLDLWRQVAAGVVETSPAAEPPSLERMGRQLLVAFQVELAASS